MSSSPSVAIRPSRLLLLAASLLAAATTAGIAMAQPADTGGSSLTLDKKGYYASRGFDVLVFSNWYDGLFSDAKMSGVEIIHHDQRTATNGDIRLSATPDQWDPIGQFVTARSTRRRAASAPAWPIRTTTSPTTSTPARTATRS